jgi:hypothetical protein
MIRLIARLMYYAVLVIVALTWTAYFILRALM